jgi:hypothetical protein
VGTDHRAPVRSAISLRLSSSAPPRVRTVPCPRRRSREAGHGPWRPRIARGRLRSALVRRLVPTRRRGADGAPVHVRRGAVADRTAFGGPRRAAGSDHTATRTCRDAGHDRALDRLVDRRRRVLRHSCHRCPPATERGCVGGAARRDIVTFRARGDVDVHDRSCPDRTGDRRTERVVDRAAMGRCFADVHRVVASLARTHYLDRSVTGATRRLALRSVAPPRRTARG